MLATPITVREKKLHDLVIRLDSEQTVDLHALPGLVELAEKFIFDEETVIRYLSDELSGYDLGEYGAVVLGCTHFVFYRKHFKRILPHGAVSYTHLRAHETVLDLVCRLLLEKKKQRLKTYLYL